MAEYEKKQIEGILKSGYSGYKLKVASEDDESHWINISPSQLKKIKSIV